MSDSYVKQEQLTQLSRDEILDIAFSGIEALLCHEETMSLDDLKAIEERLRGLHSRVCDAVSDRESEP